MTISLRILVAEDNQDSREMLCEMIAMLGHERQSASSAEEAIALFETETFDVLLADIELPGMSGIELADIAVKSMPGIKVIFASGYGYLVADKTDFDFLLLPKPYGMQQLKHALDQIISA